MRLRPIVGYVRRVVKESGYRKANVNVVFLNSRTMRKMNREYLSHDYGTDVISFCLERKDTLEGEIYINLDKARQQAKEYSVTFTNEVARLVIHGALHLVGYDDKGKKKAAVMKNKEEKQLAYWFS